MTGINTLTRVGVDAEDQFEVDIPYHVERLATEVRACGGGLRGI